MFDFLRKSKYMIQWENVFGEWVPKTYPYHDEYTPKDFVYDMKLYEGWCLSPSAASATKKIMKKMRGQPNSKWRIISLYEDNRAILTITKTNITKENQ